MLAPTVDLHVAASSAEPSGLADREAGDASVPEGVFGQFHIVGLDDGGDQFHGALLVALQMVGGMMAHASAHHPGEPQHASDTPDEGVAERAFHSLENSDGHGLRPLTLPHVGPLAATGLGTLGIVGVVIVLLPLGQDSSRIVHALLLMVPVIAAGLLGGRAAAVAVSAEAAAAFSMFLEPIGSPAVRIQTDVVALCVFVVVAAAMGLLVATVVNTERQRVAAEHDQLEALERTDRQRRALLRSVSHDLRTPLATIRAAAGELYDGVDYEPAGRHELLGLVLAETERLDRIVANLLSLSRIEAGALLPDLQPTNLDELVTLCTQRLSTLLDPYTVTIAVDGELPLVDLDYSQIDQVVTNLLENAARHSSADGAIAVELRGVTDGVELAVLDDGVGFPPDSADKLFTPFAMATGSGSSGIGLAICRSIVDAHRGSISAENRPEGGAAVTVVLPAHR